MRILKRGRELPGVAYVLCRLVPVALVLCGLIPVGITPASLMAWGQKPSEPVHSSLDVAILYTPLLTNVVSADRFTMQGGTLQMHGQFYRGWGAVADVSVLQSASSGSARVGLDLVASTFGARYTWALPRRRFSFFGQGTLGEVNGLNSTFPSLPLATATGKSIAFQAGGGITIGVSRRFALRALDAEWLRTQLPNSTTNVQNSLRIGAGIVFRSR